jgi:hypothetical protein
MPAFRVASIPSAAEIYSEIESMADTVGNIGDGDRQREVEKGEQTQEIPQAEQYMKQCINRRECELAFPLT